MYDMYPASWRGADESEPSTRHHRRPVVASRRRRRTANSSEIQAVQKAMNRRDNGGEPVQ